jgi:hypothetical protein
VDTPAAATAGGGGGCAARGTRCEALTFTVIPQSGPGSPQDVC